MKHLNRHKAWSTKLGRWVVAFGGAGEVANSLRPMLGYQPTRHAIYHWVSGRRLPRLEVVQALISMSHGGLRLGDFTRRSSTKEGSSDEN